MGNCEQVPQDADETQSSCLQRQSHRKETWEELMTDGSSLGTPKSWLQGEILQADRVSSEGLI